jgi:hypothetical protein
MGEELEESSHRSIYIQYQHSPGGTEENNEKCISIVAVLAKI